MIRTITKSASSAVQDLTETVGIITNVDLSNSHTIVIDGATYGQVFSVNGLRYEIGMQVKVLMDRGKPMIAP